MTYQSWEQCNLFFLLNAENCNLIKSQRQQRTYTDINMIWTFYLHLNFELPYCILNIPINIINRLV